MIFPIIQIYTLSKTSLYFTTEDTGETFALKNIIKLYDYPKMLLMLKLLFLLFYILYFRRN